MQNIKFIKMKKIIILLSVLFSFDLHAQEDIQPRWSYVLTGGVGEFIEMEYLVRSELIKQGATMEQWCYPLIDSSGSIYACEIPEIARFIAIQELKEIMSYIVSFDSQLITLEQLKEATIESNVEQKYKDLILSIALIDRNKYRINNDFNLFKQ